MKKLAVNTIQKSLKPFGLCLAKLDDHDARTQASLKRLVPSGKPVIFDVGGNIGQSIDSFLYLWPSAEIHSFEPDPVCADALVQKYKNRQNIQIIEAAVSDTAGQAVFYKHHSSKLNSFLKLNLESKSNKEYFQNTDAKSVGAQVNQAITVQKITLADYVRDKDIARVDFLKIDTQGHEVEVLRGMGEALKKVKVLHCEIMFWDMYDRSFSFSDIENIIAPYGFVLFSLPRVVPDKYERYKTGWVEAVYVNSNA